MTCVSHACGNSHDRRDEANVRRHTAPGIEATKIKLNEQPLHLATNNLTERTTHHQPANQPKTYQNQPTAELLRADCRRAPCSRVHGLPAGTLYRPSHVRRLLQCTDSACWRCDCCKALTPPVGAATVGCDCVLSCQPPCCGPCASNRLGAPPVGATTAWPPFPPRLRGRSLWRTCSSPTGRRGARRS